MSAVGIAAQVRAVVRKDLAIERGSLVSLRQVLPFAVAVLFAFSIALDVNRPTLDAASTGVMWATILFSAILVTQRSFSADAAAGVRDRTLGSGFRPEALYLGKVVSLSVQLVVLTVSLAVGVTFLFGVAWGGWALLVVTGLLADVALAAACALYGPIAGGVGGREALLSLLLLPIMAPVLLCVSRAWEIAGGRGIGGGWSWAGMLVVISVLYLVCGSLLWGPMLED